jgi:hypothetical protein
MCERHVDLQWLVRSDRRTTVYTALNLMTVIVSEAAWNSHRPVRHVAKGAESGAAACAGMSPRCRGFGDFAHNRGA